MGWHMRTVKKMAKLRDLGFQARTWQAQAGRTLSRSNSV
jgi:hypothetical protein